MVWVRSEESDEMTLEYIRKIIGTILLVSLISLGFSKEVRQYLHIPKTITIFENDVYTIEKNVIPAQAQVQDVQNAFKVSESGDELQLKGTKSGDGQILYEIKGMPVKNVNVKVLPELKVIPGGQSIGVKLNTLGVLVVGFHQIETEAGKKSPGESAGVEVGDMITKINGTKIEKMSDIIPFIQEAGRTGRPLAIEVKRNNKVLNTKLTPVKDKSDKTYRIGLYIRDSAAGIGTMTFYDPKSKKYGALGHVISDMDTKKPIVVENGKIVRSTVTSIEKGRGGSPGEKLARFSEKHEVIGSISKNSPFGIFGRLNQEVKNGIMDKPIPVAFSHQVKEGPAQILTVVDQNKVEAFDVEIVSTVNQKFPATKGMVIKVTDKELLKKTGGIVQGMSGSPIIQDGKLVGAVTHVFVNDPTSGYGVHIEWMLQDAGISIDEKQQKAS